MTIRSFERDLSSGNVWVFPGLFVVVALLGHVWSGALAWPIDSADHQRDFNTALGITLLTAIFWAAVRATHQNVASALIAVLLKRHQLSQFTRHRWVLSRKFQRQLLVFFCLAAVMPCFYLINEGLLPRFSEPAVFMITLTAVPFWLFVFLFIAQVTTNTRYVFGLAFSPEQRDADNLDMYKAVFDMAIANAKYALGVIAILPVFWLNKPIPALDILIVGLGVSVLVCYLFLPVWRVCIKIRKLRKQIRCSIDDEVSAIVRQQVKGQSATNFSTQLEDLYCRRDQAIMFVGGRQRKALLLSLLWLPSSISLIALIEWFLLP